MSVAFAAFAMPLAACRPDFAPFNRVEALRILAVQAEPAAPLTGETSTLSALVFTPTPDPTLAYHWTWCPLGGAANDGGYACPFKEDELNAGLAAASLPPLPPFELGTGETAALTNSIDPQVSAAVCAGGLTPGMKFDCSGGFPIQLTLTVTTSTDTVTAVQKMKLRFDPTMSPNANPPVDGLQARVGGVLMDLTDVATVTLPRDRETPLFALAQPSISESYLGLDDDGMPATLKERMFMTWFVESGDTDDTRTSFVNNGTTDFAALLENKWIPAKTKDYASSTARLFVVLHDNRGGVSWRSAIVNLEPSP
ncbi:MAG TPA: hypothetical protein VHU40_06090 [Polyangia bacterium]|nr:hypothetical protein [Polyangia bacterium]